MAEFDSSVSLEKHGNFVWNTQQLVKFEDIFFVN